MAAIVKANYLSVMTTVKAVFYGCNSLALNSNEVQSQIPLHQVWINEKGKVKNNKEVICQLCSKEVVAKEVV